MIRKTRHAALRSLSRRTFLRGAGGTAVALPLLDIMGCSRRGTPSDIDGRPLDGSGGSSDHVDDAGSKDYDPGGALAPRRFMVLVSPNGYIDEAWFPSESSTGGEPSETDFILGPTMSSLEAHRASLLVLRGIDNIVEKNGHGDGACSLLTGAQCDIDPITGEPVTDKLGLDKSIDWAIAERIIAQSANAPAHVHLALSPRNTINPHAGVSYSGYRALVDRVTKPVGLWEKLFAGTAGLTPQEIAQRTARRLSLVDDVLGDYHRLRDKVGQADRLRLEHHIEALSEVERRIKAVNNDCKAPEAPDASIDNQSHELPGMTLLFFDLLKLAFACDLTRSVTYLMRTEGASANQTFGWLGLAKDGTLCDKPLDERVDCAPNTACDDNCEGIHSTNHHALSHHEGNPIAREKLLKIQSWYVSQFGELISRLASVQEGDGTLLDNSLCALTSPIGRGNHSNHDMKWLLAGSCGNRIATGRYLDYRSGGAGVAHNALLLSFMHAMGHDNVTCFGDAEACTGPLSGFFG